MAQGSAQNKTKITDGSGNIISATSNALDINIKSGNPTSITANAGTNLNTSSLALETGGNLAAIVSASPLVIPITQYLFLGVAGSVTATGILLDINGAQVGNGFTATIPQGTGTNNASALSTIYGQSIPVNAVNAALYISGDIYWAACNGNSGQTSDFKANYANYPKFLVGDSYIPLGKTF